MEWTQQEFCIMTPTGMEKIRGSVDPTGLWGARTERVGDTHDSLQFMHSLTHLATGQRVGKYRLRRGLEGAMLDLAALPGVDWSSSKPGADKDAVLAIVAKHGGVW